VPAPGPDTAVRGRTALGLVVDPGVGGVGGLRLHGRTLVAHAFEALAAVPGLEAVVVGGSDPSVAALAADEPWRRRAAGGLVLHDPGCPLLPTDTIVRCLHALGAGSPATAIIGVRPVTDTIKEVVDGSVVGTVDRAALAALAAPVVVGPGLLDPLSARFPLAGDLADLARVVQALATMGTVVPLEVPSSARRVSDEFDVELLECLHELRKTLRER
jgi:2-C-methyl-D-erythritol 4-phosphate cytidylyltransferase